MKRIRNSILSWALLLCALALATVSYLSGFEGEPYCRSNVPCIGGFDARPLFHADGVFLPILFEDIYAKGGRFFDWKLGRHMFFVPDYLLFFPAYYVADTTYGQLLAYMLLQVLLSFAAVYFLAKQCVPRNASLAASVVTLLWVVLAVQGEPFFYMLTSVHHYGAFPCMLFFMACWFQYQDEECTRARWRWLAALCVFSFVSSLSDQVFLAQTAAPFLLACVWFNVLRREKAWKPYAVPTLVLAISLVSLLIQKWLPQLMSEPLSVDIKYGREVVSFLQSVWKTVLRFPEYGALLVLYLVLCARFLRFRAHSMISDRFVFLLWFSLFSSFSTIFSLEIHEHAFYHERYILQTFFLPVLIIAFWIGGHARFSAPVWWAVPCVLFVAKPAWEVYHAEWNFREHSYPEQVACIDDVLREEGLRHGMAQYWSAKNTQVFSKLDLSLAQYRREVLLNEGDRVLYFMVGERLMTSKRFFRNCYDFALLFRENSNYSVNRNRFMSADDLARIHGEPEKVVACGNIDVHVYGKNRLRIDKQQSCDTEE